MRISGGVANFCIFMIEAYRRFISPLKPPCCRFYPSCSAYALLVFRFHHPAAAALKVILRILRCNGLFRGGFAHPTVKFSGATLSGIEARKLTSARGAKIGFAPQKLRPDSPNFCKNDIAYWLIPTKGGEFYIIKQG